MRTLCSIPAAFLLAASTVCSEAVAQTEVAAGAPAAVPSPALRATTTVLPARIEPREPPLSRRTWYGWQSITADGLATAMIMGGSGWTLAGIGTYVLGGPIIHLTHGHVLRSVGSLGLRIGAPLMGVVVGCSASARSESSCDIGALVGSLVGLAAASAVDASFAYDAEPHRPMPATASASIAPTFVATRHGGTIALQGVF